MNIDTQVPANWYETFFTTPVNQFWEAMVPPHVAQSDVAFASRHLQLQASATILDVACGAGRHALPLARLGYRVTGIDISADAIARARGTARQQGLEVAFDCIDMLKLDVRNQFDGIVCFGNSLGYCEPERTRGLFERFFNALHAGGRLVLDTSICAESVLPVRTRQQYDFPRGTYVTEVCYDAMLSALKTRAWLTLDGRTYEQRVEDRKPLHGAMDGGLVRELVTSVHGGMNLMALVHSLPNS